MKHKLIDSLGSAIEKTGNAFDKNFTSKEEFLSFLHSVQKNLLEAKEAILLAESQGNWMQRSWRPLLMLSFGGIIIYSKFFAPIFSLPAPELEQEFWELLKLGMGGYIIGRSVEKTASSVQMVLRPNRRRSKNQGEVG